MELDGIHNPIRLRKGTYYGEHGTYWAWPVDGYYDLHFQTNGYVLDGSEVIEEFLPTLAAARKSVREWLFLENPFRINTNH